MVAAGPVVARGAGLAYGDAACNSSGAVLLTQRLDKFLEFDAATGLVRCQAGVTLGDILAVAVPAGWFLSVTPGTARVSVGGSIACDVHGKNHHVAGSFGNHVTNLRLLTGGGEEVDCSPTVRPDVFWATVGGMGMTGVVLEASLQLMPVAGANVVARNIATADLDETLRVLDEHADGYYSVVWLDAGARGRRLGRGIVMLGEHAADSGPRIAPALNRRHLPCGLPSGVLPLMGPAFNTALYALYSRSAAPATVKLADYFYPLDKADNWNRLYGPRGFLEYQFVLPDHGAAALIVRMIEELQRCRLVSMLTSFKRMGPGNPAPLSFPMAGLACSFDLAASRAQAHAVLDLFDEWVAAAGGRVYLAKDGRLRPDVLDAMYPRRDEWLSVVQNLDPQARLRSDMERRLNLRRLA